VPDRATSYALAGAISVTSAELLQDVHRAAGGPSDDVSLLSDQQREIATAAAHARSAVAACSALVARLLIDERGAARHDLSPTSARVIQAALADTTAGGDDEPVAVVR
jgi:hypothetical protein